MDAAFIIKTENDAVQNFSKFFVFIDNISSYPDTVLLKKFLNLSASGLELQKISTDLGFDSFEDMNQEFLMLSTNVKLAAKNFRGFFQYDGERIKVIARKSFQNNKIFYKISFKKLPPYMNTSEITEDKRQYENCCPCTKEYNYTMDAAFWNAAIQTEICAGFGLASGGLGSLACMAAVLTQYYTTKHIALKKWDDCVTNGPGFDPYQKIRQL